MSQASEGSAHGLEAQLRNGPKVYFGTDDDLGAKWAAAAAVLADSGSAGADYIDVTVAVTAGGRGGLRHGLDRELGEQPGQLGGHPRYRRIHCIHGGHDRRLKLN